MHVYIFIHLIKGTLCIGKYRKKNNGKGPLVQSFTTALRFQKKIKIFHEVFS